MNITLISSRLSARHTLKDPVSLYSHPVEDLMMDALKRPGLHVHWGVYMSGKTWAALNAGLRLQASENRLVIRFHGFDFSGYNTNVRHWLRRCIGVPEDERDIAKFFNRPACVIIDHFESCLKDDTRDELLCALRELGVGVLLLVSSWERAMELRTAGCALVGHAGCGRWTAEELEALRLGKEQNEETMRLSVLSGTPMYLDFADECKKISARRAVIQDAEWRKGVLALEQGVVEEAGTFPDKQGVFHWRLPTVPVGLECPDRPNKRVCVM